MSELALKSTGIENSNLIMLKDSSELRKSCILNDKNNINKNKLFLNGNGKGEICCFDISSNKIIFRNKLHNSAVTCLIESEDKLISCSRDKTINIYKKVV